MQPPSMHRMWLSQWSHHYLRREYMLGIHAHSSLSLWGHPPDFQACPVPILQIQGCLPDGHESLWYDSQQLGVRSWGLLHLVACYETGHQAGRQPPTNIVLQLPCHQPLSAPVATRTSCYPRIYLHSHNRWCRNNKSDISGRTEHCLLRPRCQWWWWHNT